MFSIETLINCTPTHLIHIFLVLFFIISPLFCRDFSFLPYFCRDDDTVDVPEFSDYEGDLIMDLPSLIMALQVITVPWPQMPDKK